MEGVGARFGRTSNRYAPATVFTGPVRKWKKKWVQLTPSSSTQQHHHSSSNGASNGANGSSHLLMYKWTPITPSRNKDNRDNNNNNGSNSDNAEAGFSNKDGAVSADEPPRRKFKFIPVALLEAENNETSEQNEEEANSIEVDVDTAKTTSKMDGHDEKPDINDTPMDETQASEEDPPERHDLNKSTLDLSLGLKSHDSENESDHSVGNDQQE